MKRRIFCVALALILCLGMMPGAALAADEETCVIIAGYRLTAEETNDTTIEEGRYPYTYARVDENGVTVVDIANDTNFNVVLQNWYGNLYLFLYGADIPGATRINGEEHLSTGEIRGGAGIYCKQDLTIIVNDGYGDNIVHAALPEEGQATGAVWAIYVDGNLTISSDNGGQLTATAEGTQYEKGTSIGMYAHGRLSVTGSAQVTAIGGESIKTAPTNMSGSYGAQALTTIEVIDHASLTGIGGEAESCVGILCDQMSVWNQGEVIGKAESGSVYNVGLSFNKGNQNGLTIAGKSRVTAIAGGSSSNSSIGIEVPYLSSSYFQYFPIKLIEGETELDNGEYVNEPYLEVRSNPSSANGYAFNDDGILLTYEGGTLIASGTTDLCKRYPGIKIASYPAEHIWRTTPEGGYQYSEPEYFVYQYPYDKTYLEMTPGYQVTVKSADETMGTVSGEGGYKGDTPATVEATAKPGYQFAGWMKNGSEVNTDNPYTFTVTENTALTAVFEELPATGIKLDADILAVAEGKTNQLTASPIPDGAKLESVTWESSDSSIATVDENGTVTGIKAGTATITVKSGEFTAICTVTVNPVDPAPVRPPELPEDNDSLQMKVEVETGLSQVPEALQNNENLNTPEKIETELKTVIKQADSNIKDENTAVYDVELMVSIDGGQTWTKATGENFPPNGLTVTLPYPDGTTSSYKFTVVHMFSIGDNAGETETPDVTNTRDGIQFTVTGLSPISVGWIAPSFSSSGVSTYPVTVETADHGTVTMDRKNASAGTTVTLTVKPDEGYVLDSLTVTDGQDKELKLVDKGDGTFTFTMPNGNVTVSAKFSKIDVVANCPKDETCPLQTFTDLELSAWYHDGIHFCVEKGLKKRLEGEPQKARMRTETVSRLYK